MISRKIPRKLVWIAICLWAAVANCTLYSYHPEDGTGDVDETRPDAGMVSVELPRIDSEIPEFYHDDHYVAGTVVVISQRYEILESGVRPVTVGPDIKLNHELFIRRATAVPSRGTIDVLTIAPSAVYDQNSKLVLYTALVVTDDTEFRTTEGFLQMTREDQRQAHLVLYEVWEYKGFGRGYALTARFTLGVSYHLPRFFAALCWEVNTEGDMSAHVIWDNDG